MADRELLGCEVWHWPELQAFLKRLGVNPPESTSRLVITIGADEIVRVEQTHAPTTTEPSRDFVLYHPPPLNRLRPVIVHAR